MPGLTHVTVKSAEEVLTLLERGSGARAVAATGVHDHSSRSHSVLLAEVACRAGPDALPATGRLFLGMIRGLGGWWRAAPGGSILTVFTPRSSLWQKRCVGLDEYRAFFFLPDVFCVACRPQWVSR